MKSRYKYGLLVGLALGLAGAASVKADVATSANNPAQANPVTVVAPSTTSTNENAVAPASENQPSPAKVETSAQSVAPVKNQPVAAQSTVSDQTASQPANQVQQQTTQFAAVAPKASSYHSSGWYKEPGSKNTWQYFGSNGKAYQNGWYVINGQWYFFQYGRLAVDGVYDDFMDGDEDSQYQEWQGNTGGNYLFDYNGHYRMNVWYKLPSSKNTWYYFGSNGKQYQNGWYVLGGQWYFFQYGRLAVDGVYDDFMDGDEDSQYQKWQGNTGGSYLFDYNGHYRMNVWYKLPSSKNTWYYFGSNGKQYQNGWYVINGQWYYFNYTSLAVDGIISDGYNDYLFDHNGHYVVSQWHKDQNSKNTWYYLGSNGKAYEAGWYMIGGQWYYFDWSGHMAADETVDIDGAEYHFDHFGHYWQS